MDVSKISRLISDIYKLVLNKEGWFDEEISNALRNTLSKTLADHFNAQRYSPTRGTLRMSGLGPKCPRALWHAINTPQLAEPLPPWAEIKFAYGHVLEALAITLSKAAGHEVTGEQDELVLDGIVGHRDGVIDGCVVDVKSCSSIAFSKFKNKTIQSSDSFGYLDQLSGYVVASNNDPLVKVKDRGYILAIDKTLGHVVLYEHIVDERAIRERIKLYKGIVAKDVPPACECSTKHIGASGNIQLAVPASYSPFKYCCFPFLRTFLYSDGPIYLTKVVVRPSVHEINRSGEIINGV